MRTSPQPGQGLIPAHAGKTRSTFGQETSWRAHPRSRGENLSFMSERLAPWGSSPLTRGKPDQRRRHALRVGLIPAHAGKTPTRHTVAPCPWAHPRSRGENSGAVDGGRDGLGSSPLTRGKRKSPRQSGYVLGLIPAHAGKTGCRGILRVPSRAHPRSRGENMNRWCMSVGGPGSSPLTRGKRASLALNAVERGLIPAHAGKT